jgi:nucleotide-binding universal stress UspA family protein
MQEAFSLAEQCEAKVYLLHVWQLPTVAYPQMLIWPPGDAIEQAAVQMMKRLVESLPGARRARVSQHVVLGAPAREILSFASGHECDLIVMGTHGRHGPARLLLGSVAEHVVREAPCPVLTVHRTSRHPRESDSSRDAATVPAS